MAQSNVSNCPLVRKKWRTQGFGQGSNLAGDGEILALSDDGHLVVIPAALAYKELGRVKAVSGKCWSTPVLGGGRIYARSTKGSLYRRLRRLMSRSIKKSPKPSGSSETAGLASIS